MTSTRKIVTELLRREGKKKQIDRAQMNEIVGHLSDLIYFQHENGSEMRYCENKNMIEEVLCMNGKRRAKRKKKV
jgi:hypothetical protein